MKKITIDASTLLPGRKMDGVGRTTLGLVDQFASMNLPFELSLFSQRMRGERITDYPFKKCHLPLPRWDIISTMTKNLPIIETMCHADLYHIPHNYAPFNRLDRTVTTIHDAMFLSHPEPHLGHDKLAREIPPFAKKCKAIITCSEHSKKDISEFMGIDPEKIFVTYWGIDSPLKLVEDIDIVKQELHSLYGLENPFFLSVSCNIGRKNTPKLVEEYLKMAANHPTNDLVLVWNTPHQSILEMIKKSRYSNRVHILSGVSDKVLIMLYQAATATVLPTLYEGFGLPVLEAMSYGSPVITTPFSSVPEVGGDAVMYMDPNNDELLPSLEKFENLSINRDLMIQKGLAQSSQFTWGKCAKQTINIYQKLLSD